MYFRNFNIVQLVSEIGSLSNYKLSNESNSLAQIKYENLYTMNLGSIIRKLRVSAGLSQGELAKTCEISQAYLSQIEKNKRDPHIPTLQKISDVLEVPLPLLLFFSVDKNDIPERKRDAFNELYPTIRDLLNKLFPESVEAIQD